MLIYENIQGFIPEIYITVGINIMLVSGLLGIKVNKMSEIMLINAIVLIMYEIMVGGEVNNGMMEANKNIEVIKMIVTITTLIIMRMTPGKIQSLEYNVLIMMSLLGMYVLISGSDIIMIYLGIELVSLSLYILATIKRTSQKSTEAGLKYLILGAVSTGILLIGAAMIYNMTGTTEIREIGAYVWYIEGGEEGIMIMGAIMMMIAMLFKLAAAPFHMWAPDVYEGAPTIVTAYFAIVPKIVILGVVMKLIMGPFMGISESIQPIIMISAMMSLIVGALGAINQTKIKRLIAYSAIGHMGWMLIGIGGMTIYSMMTAMVYIIVYIIMSITIFAIIVRTETNYIVEWTGLGRKNPVLAITIAITLLSMAGIPPMVGFYNKYIVMIEAIQGGQWIIVGVGIMTSVISAYYYIQIIKIMYFFEKKEGWYKVIGDLVKTDTKEIDRKGTIIIGGTLYIIMSGLIYPQPILTITNIAITTTLI